MRPVRRPAAPGPTVTVTWLEIAGRPRRQALIGATRPTRRLPGAALDAGSARPVLGERCAASSTGRRRLATIAVASLVSSVAEAGALVLLTIAATSTLQVPVDRPAQRPHPGHGPRNRRPAARREARSASSSRARRVVPPGSRRADQRARTGSSARTSGPPARGGRRCGSASLQDAAGPRADGVVALLMAIAGVITSAISVVAYAGVALVADARAFAVALVLGAPLIAAVPSDHHREQAAVARTTRGRRTTCRPA